MPVRFSVIVPIYNKEQYLRQCIESILNQSYENFELILVDDGSFDSSPEIIEEYKKQDKRIKVATKHNGGLVSARKYGLNYAIGEYVVCVDADDYIKQDYLLNLNKEIELNNPDIICCNHTQLSANKETKIQLPYKNKYYSKKDIINEIYPTLIQAKDTKHFNVNIWAKAYKKGLYETIQLNVSNSVNIGEDGCLTIPYIYKSNSMSIIDDCSYVYRLNNDSMTSIKSVLPMDYPKNVSKEYLKYIDTNTYNFNDQINRFIVHQLFSASLSQFNKDKPYKEIKQTIIDSLNDEYYNNAINNASFSNNIKAILMHITLKYKLTGIIYLLSLIK